MNKSQRFYAMLAGLILVSIIIGAGLGTWLAGGNNSSTLPVQPVHGIFLDVDGDGMIDYLAFGEVVFQRPFLAPTPSAP